MLWFLSQCKTGMLSSWFARQNRGTTVMKTSGDWWCQILQKILLILKSSRFHRQVNCNCRSHEKLVTGRELITFRRGLRWIYLPYECLLFKKILPIFNICCDILSLPIQRSLNVYSFSGHFLVYQLWMMYLVLSQFFSTISR